MKQRLSASIFRRTHGRSGSARSKPSTEEADELKAELAEKGFEDAVVVADKKVVPSQDAIALSQQLKNRRQVRCSKPYKDNGSIWTRISHQIPLTQI